MKKCTCCLAVLPLDKFNFNDKNRVRTESYCKPCSTKRKVLWQKVRNMKKEPDKYHECDSCENIWLKKLGDYCAKCGEKHNTAPKMWKR